MFSALYLLLHILSIIGGSSVVAALIPQKKGRVGYDIIREVVDYFAFNFLNAKNK